MVRVSSSKTFNVVLGNKFSIRRSQAFTRNSFHSQPLFRSGSFQHSLFDYRPQTRLGEGNVFTGVCQSLCPRGRGEGYVHHMHHGIGRVPPSPGHQTWVITPPPPFPLTPNGARLASGRYASYCNAFLFLYTVTTYSIN